MRCVPEGISYLMKLVRQRQAATRNTTSSMHAAIPENNQTTSEFLFQSPLNTGITPLFAIIFGPELSTILNKINIHVHTRALVCNNYPHFICSYNVGEVYLESEVANGRKGLQITENRQLIICA